MESLSRDIENQEVKSVNKSDFDNETFEQQIAEIQEEIAEDRKQRELKLDDLMSEYLKDENGSEKENNRLNQLHEAILKLDISDKNDSGYKTLYEILDSDLNTEQKLELMVKTIHSMDGEIDVKHEDNTTEHTAFYCGNRALFFNYLFNNHNDKLNIDESNICLPYGHCMNIIKLRGQTYLVDGGAGCFNQIDDYSIEENGSWKCIKLNKPIECFKGSGIFYPFTSFPYTEKLNKEELELYTLFGLQNYSYFFTDRLYTVAQQYDPSINDKDGLERFCNDVLVKKDNPLEGILDDGDPQSIDSKENQIKLLKRQISESLPYPENKENFENIKSYIGKITENHPDLLLNKRDDTLKVFREKDESIMNALKIPKESIPKIKEGLAGKIGNTANINEISNYIITQFEKYKANEYNTNEDNRILDDDELDSIVKNFINAISIKAGQLNKDLKDYLPTYLSSL